MDGRGDFLSEGFASDFTNFYVVHISAIPNNSWHIMRGLFCGRGVYVRNRRETLILEAFVEVVKENLSWSQIERESAEHTQIAPENEIIIDLQHTLTEPQRRDTNNNNETRSTTCSKDFHRYNYRYACFNKSNTSNMSKAVGLGIWWGDVG